MSRVRVGLIGCGIISDSHIGAYKAMPEQVEVVAVADRLPEKAREAAAKLGDPRQCTDYREILASPDIDGVDICLPHHLHREVAVAALDAGKHVLCEKPMAPTLAEADAMIEAAERAGRTLVVGENFRYLPEIARAQALLAEGVLGEVILLQSVFAGWLGGPYLETAWRFKAEEVGGGALLDSGIHHVDVLLAILGRPTSVSCYLRRVRPIFPAEDIAVVTAEFAGGTLAELTVGWSLRNVPGLLFRVCGSHGALTAQRGSIEVAGEGVPGGQVLYRFEPTNGMREEVSDFVECIATGKRPLMGGTEARADVEFVLAAYESARTGKRVKL